MFYAIEELPNLTDEELDMLVTHAIFWLFFLTFMDPILQIPHDILTHVSVWLGTLTDVISFLQACRHFHALSRQRSFWICVFDTLRSRCYFLVLYSSISRD